MSSPIDILLVEDNEDHVFLTKNALEQFADSAGLSIHVVEDGEQALDFVRKKGSFQNAPTPSLILLDIKLPNKNGFEVLASIKKDKKLCAIPVVMLTSSDVEEDIIRSYGLGSNSYITKPIEIDQLQDKLRSIPSYWLNTNTLPVKFN